MTSASAWKILAAFVVGWLLGRWMLRCELQPHEEYVDECLHVLGQEKEKR